MTAKVIPFPIHRTRKQKETPEYYVSNHALENAIPLTMEEFTQMIKAIRDRYQGDEPA